MTVLPPAEIYTSLEKGVVDGAAWPVTGALSFRWNEVAKYLLRPAFGVETAPILMNFNTWNNLSQSDRAIIQQQARKVEELFYKEVVRMWRDEETELFAKGITITAMGDVQQSKLQDAWSTGIWELAAAKQPAEVEALHQFTRIQKISR
jgi:TRAP-type C4-dicarboxylate transport system substrate-binding protein